MYFIFTHLKHNSIDLTSLPTISVAQKWLGNPGPQLVGTRRVHLKGALKTPYGQVFFKKGVRYTSFKAKNSQHISWSPPNPESFDLESSLCSALK